MGNDFCERVKICLAYIDEHLDEEITAERMAEICGYSLFYFCHSFRNCLNMAPGDYVRKRRLRKSIDMLLGGASVTETAFSCGFSSNAGFTKAFRREYGISPQEAKQTGCKPAAATRNLNLLFYREATDMKAEVKKLDAMKAFCYRIDAPFDGNPEKDLAYWDKVNFKNYPKYPAGVDDKGEIGIWMHPDCADGKIDYYFGYITSDEKCPEGFCQINLPEANYAVFRVETQKNMGEAVRAAWKEIFPVWFDNHPEICIADHALTFEVYKDDDAFICVAVK